MNELEMSKSVGLYDMILDGLIALTSDQLVGEISRKSVSETIFLGKWLKRAKKQKRYPRTISVDIDTFLHLYAVEGRSANLASLFHQIYREFQISSDVPQHFEFGSQKRFNMTIDKLAENGWHMSLPINQNEKVDEPYKPLYKKEIFTTKWYIYNAFNEQN